MPAIVPDEDIGLAFDIHGCPNRCRHCWLGPRPVSGRMTEDDLRWAVAQFRSFRKPGEQGPFFRSLRVSTWAREPDYSDEYRRLYDLERELSDGETGRPDYVLSMWRLARDPDYAPWAYEIGVRLCQLRFFGLEEATDWGYRRRGGFRDLLIATERLLAAGIRVRWRWYFTKKIIPDLPGLIALTEELDLCCRCEALGGPFELWFLSISPEGEAWHIEHLRPTAADLDRVPRLLLEETERRTGRPIGMPERKLLPTMLVEQRPVASNLSDLGVPDFLWFHVVPGFDVYLLHCDTTPAFRLGNLKSDGVAAIVDRYENDGTSGLQALYHVSVSELAKRFGRRYGERLYDPVDLKARWAKMWVDENL
jgi:hypothetical protein